ARRNQALIDRQIQLLDELEAQEEDAEVLEHLYRLDHLATRMRRNAESLLILAGSESGQRRSKPVDVVDVVRAALGEVEDYERIDLGSLDTVTLRGPAVSDVAHLLAELLENATQFSPPETTVRIDGTRSGGSYQIVITDGGVGMGQDQIDDMNEILRDPPVTGLALSRSLGCLVTARLAARHGITVRLRARDDPGLAAYVVLPRHLMSDDPTRGEVGGVEPAHPAPDQTVQLPAADPWLADWSPLVGAEPSLVHRDDADPSPAHLSEALPGPAAFDAGIHAFLDDAGGPGAVASPITDETASASSTSTLQRRVPGATVEPITTTIEEAPRRRSPDEVRTRLLRYRSGLQAGRAAYDPTREEGP
ncbi:MAG: ATP-binding protein, partial [Acidimicrobiales bacterium]